jgi:hypothetical protein
MVRSSHFWYIRGSFTKVAKYDNILSTSFFTRIICPFHIWPASPFWYFGIFVYSGCVESFLSKITSWMIFETLSKPPDFQSWVSNPLLARLHTFCYPSFIPYWIFQFSFHSASFPYLKPLISAHSNAHTQNKDATQFLHVTDHVFSKCSHEISYINPGSLTSLVV